MLSREEGLKHDMKKGRSARVARIVTLVVSAYFLTCFLFSFRMNPVGQFFSTIETTPFSALFQGILFAISLIFVFLFAYTFKEASVRLILLISIQAYLAISALRCGESGFVVGALIVGVAVLFHGYAVVHNFRLSRNSSGTPNHNSLNATDDKNLNGSGKKRSDDATAPKTGDATDEDLRSETASRVNRRLFIVLCVLSAIIPLGFVSQLFFKSSGDAPKNPVFFGTSAGWLWISAFGAAVLGVFLYMSFKKGVGRNLSLERSPRLSVVLFLLALIPAAILMIIMVARISGFLSPTYDMGIFTQMFHNMKTTGAPITTLERDMSLSHFKIHMSPIFYLILPFYLIAPSAETLQVLQILVVLSGVIPLDLLAKRYFLGSKAWRLAAAVLYVLQPGLLGSNLYDLHENCFLAPLTLWLIYACHTRRTVIVVFFAALTLMVKEDAALYVVAIALFVFFGGISADNHYQRRKDLIHGMLLLAGALIYFGWVSTYLNNAGYGIMTYRFNNLMIYKELGVLGIIPAILQNPAYYLSTFWTMEKIGYLMVVLGSLGFLPLFQRKGAHYFLIIPLVVMNLSSNYTYQYDLRFQYHYGSVALLVFMAMMAVAGYTERMSRTPVTLPALRKTSRTALLRHGAPDQTSLSEVNHSPKADEVAKPSVRIEQHRKKNDNDGRQLVQQIVRAPQQSTLRPGLRVPSIASRQPVEPSLRDERDERDRLPSRSSSENADRSLARHTVNEQKKQNVRLARIEKSSRTSRANYRQNENRVLAAGGFVRPQEVEDELSPNNGAVDVRRRHAGKATPSAKTAVASKDPRSVRLRRVLAFVVAFALFCAASQSLLLLSERRSTILYEKANRQSLNAIRHCLDQIPKEASVGTTTFFTSYLANRAEIYDLGYHKRSLKDGHLEYLVFDQRWHRYSDEDVMAKALEYGYVRMSGTPENVVILKWPGAHTP